MSSLQISVHAARHSAAARAPRANRAAAAALGLAVALVCGTKASAQVAPDAGRVLRESEAPRAPAERSTVIRIDTGPVDAAQSAGGEQVRIAGVRIQGARRFHEGKLLDVLGDVTAQSYDLAGLHALAARVTQFYREHGYPFARAYLPPQETADGVLTIEVIEGRYGGIQPAGDERLHAGAARFLAPLQPGDLIESRSLERTLLILDDQPGVEVTPLLRPGAAVGTGDLVAHVARTDRVQATIGLDNHGNRYVGSRRLLGALTVNSPFLFGDRLGFEALYTEEDLWFGRTRYELPLGASGLRGNIGYSHTDYQLGKEFAILGQAGEAKIGSMGLSFPLVRSQRANLVLSGTLQYKELLDRRDLVDTRERKSSRSVPIMLEFDHRDAVGGGGLTYGALSWTPGSLDLDEQLAAADRLDTRGGFHKINLDLARVQNLARGFSAFARVSGQWASRNLDSSEGLSLGGAYGVRAYPQGEGFGDEGWFAQAELRYTLGGQMVYLFHDTGVAYVNAEPLDSADDLRRRISGAGVGLRLRVGGWNMDAASAWRTHGGAPQSDSRDANPVLWASASYSYR